MPSDLASHWALDPDVLFLNHASFGAAPRTVLDAQSAWRERMEREPVAFFARDLEPAIDAARASLAGFVAADPDDLAFVPNATAGINTVARSLQLEPGDELVVLDHAYPAARNAITAVAEASGARVVTASVAFPDTTPELVVRAIMDTIGPRTRLVLLDHVTSATALVFPVAEIVARLAERGIDTLIDGAHAPGMVEVDLASIGAAYYSANCHKWMCAPKGSAFLHVRRDRQERVRPLSISHGATSPRTDRSRFRLEHDWTGTVDPTPWLAIPDAIEQGSRLLPGGWPALRDRARALALHGRDALCRALGQPPPAPDEMIGAMASVPLGPLEDGPRPASAYDDRVHAALLREGIQVAIASWPLPPADGEWQRLIRISAAPYVSAGDVERLATAVSNLSPR